MGVLIIVIILAAIVGAVVWNHRNANLAQEGVRFKVRQPLATVVSAIDSEFCVGAKAKTRSALSVVTVTRSGGNSFRTTTKLGDVGHISVEATSDGGSVVEAATDQLFVGADTRSVEGCGGCYTAISATIVSGLWRLLGISPNGGKIHRFQQRVEGRVTRRLQKQTRSSG